MSQPMEDRTVTANQARAEYEAKCQEIKGIETAKRYLEELLSKLMQRCEPLVAFHTVGDTMYAVDSFWMLLNMYADAERKLSDAKAARDYTYAVWQSASAEPHRG
ncbi:hypothetical protein FB561_7377 [Kribbella amoyensis]|uniref:Uncharacterized protein n=1 Tax=Kribbella amoyensis TaxID=996641 RepID=A0A561B3R7_9ACTN|nr:hypothetical protein [Kribbella amoyensis]TWD73484.1 hypothetical protein FB561_7377 [Kribbella amoyensis]